MNRWTATVSVVILAAGSLAAPKRTTIFVPLDAQPSWRDMAYLAAIPASERANEGGGSLVALDAKSGFGPEFADYMTRFKPDSVWLLDDPKTTTLPAEKLPPVNLKVQKISVDSAESAAVDLSKRFWTASKVAVVCPSRDYDAALFAASLAGLLDAPLLFTTDEALNPATATEIARLGVTEVIALGNAAPKFSGKIIPLSSPFEAMKWVRNRGFKVSYLAAVNPFDRANTTTRKLSLIGAQLAAGRKGLVAPLRAKVEWKRPFESKVLKGTLPKGIPASEAKPKEGTIEIGGSKLRFILTGGKEESNLRLSIDRTGNGTFSAPLASGDTVEIDDRRWAVSLGTRTKFGQTDVHLTWPTANDLRTRLGQFYTALGSAPEHLCLVGFPDALPHAIMGRGGIVEEQVSDLPYAQLQDNEFAHIGVGRVIAESVSYGSLYAARALTYRDLVQKTWGNLAGQAEWENTFAPLFENVGYAKTYHMESESVPWIVPPSDPSGGRRAPSFTQESALARAAVLAHSEHSSWQGLGAMFNWDAEVLMAPTVVESGGCGTACLDREVDNRSVVARMLRLGAVSFAGGSREHSAEAQPLRMEFWNGVLAGMSLGQAHRKALNAGLLIIRERGEGPGGAYRYNTNIRLQFGDPALVLHVPAAPKTTPAHSVLEGNRVSVFAPEKWSVVPAFVPPDWKDWAGKPLFAIRGPGAFSMSSWSSKGRDEETPLVGAEFTTKKKVKAIRLVQSPTAPLGWPGKWQTSTNPDGSFTTRFTVRMVDFDPEKGKILSKVDRLDFDLEFE